MAKYDEISSALAGRRVIREYPFPGLDGTLVGVRALSDDELDEIRLTAAAVCKTKGVDMVIDPSFVDRLIHRMTIAKAFFDVDKTQDRFFRSHEQVAELDNLLVITLYELYCTNVQRSDPYLYATKEKVEEIAETLGKSPSAEASMSLFDRPTLLSLSLSLARRLRETLPTPR